jgi:hypothetical protein
VTLIPGRIGVYVSFRRRPIRSSTGG